MKHLILSTQCSPNKTLTPLPPRKSPFLASMQLTPFKSAYCSLCTVFWNTVGRKEGEENPSPASIPVMLSSIRLPPHLDRILVFILLFDFFLLRDLWCATKMPRTTRTDQSVATPGTICLPLYQDALNKEVMRSQVLHDITRVNLLCKLHNGFRIREVKSRNTFRRNLFATSIFKEIISTT